MMGDVVIEREIVNNIEVYRLSPRVKSPRAVPVLYLHGGAYIRPITSFHWRFLRSIVQQTGCTFTVPLYPLAPEANCAQTVDAVTNVYRRECARAGLESVAVMGDSAGGGLALALCYALRQKAIRLPRSLVLICPWLDVTMTNPSIALTEKSDPMLAVVGTREAGRLYAGDLDLRHCYVSPLYGEPGDLPPVLLFAGTNDIAHHDALLFAEKARIAGSLVDLQIGQGMIHVWPILPIPEGKEARAKIARHLLADL
jgi:acetyl esterase/lipase